MADGDVRFGVGSASEQGRAGVQCRRPEPGHNLKEHTMSTTDRSTHDCARPQYSQPSTSARSMLAFVAVVMSSTLLGGVLSLFEACATDAVLRRAAAEVPAVATHVVMPPARSSRPA
jgi:hypothetical protein